MSNNNENENYNSRLNVEAKSFTINEPLDDEQRVLMYREIITTMERFQPTLDKFKRWARQAGTPTDIRIARQLEASFCVSRQIVKSNGGVPLVGPDFPEADWQFKALKGK